MVETENRGRPRLVDFTERDAMEADEVSSAVVGR
jgi:hypothetical protein